MRKAAGSLSVAICAVPRVRALQNRVVVKSGELEMPQRSPSTHPHPCVEKPCPASCSCRCCRLCTAAGKLAGLDKKLSRSLDAEVAQITDSGTSPLELSRSPVGPLTDASRYVGVRLGAKCVVGAQPAGVVVRGRGWTQAEIDVQLWP